MSNKNKITGTNARTARVEAIRAQQAREQRRKRVVIGGAAGALVLALAGGGVWAVQQQTPPASRTEGAQASAADTAAAGSSGVVVATPITYSGLARGHVNGSVTYAQTPPAGGDHAGAWVNCGVYTSPVQKEAAVHSLEHGAIWITYRPDLPAEQVAALRASVRNQPYGLLSPYDGLPTPVVATVWGTQLRLQSATDPQLAAFIDRYKDAASAPEPRGECTGGIGTPLK